MKTQTETVPQLPVFKATLVLFGLLVVAGAAWVVYYVANEQMKSAATADALETVRHFADLANANDARARELLGAAPIVSEDAVPPAEAERLVAETILHKPMKVQQVAAVKGDKGQRFKLVLEGSATSDRIVVQTPQGPQPQQKMLYNADLIVEVKDGKIRGVKAMLHEDP